MVLLRVAPVAAFKHHDQEQVEVILHPPVCCAGLRGKMSPFTDVVFQLIGSFVHYKDIVTTEAAGW